MEQKVHILDQNTANQIALVKWLKNQHLLSKN